MNGSEEALNHLLEALKVSPENVPLRKHIAGILIEMDRLEEAAEHLSEAIKYAPADDNLKVDLATVYHKQEKNSTALVLLEELLARNQRNARAFLLHALVCYAEEEYDQALESYQEAIALDHALRNVNLENQLARHGAHSEDPYGGREPASVYEEDIPYTEIERPAINFSDVGGMEEVKEEIALKIIQPLKHPELYQAYGKAVGGGILLYGPPGCGKTHLARATAGEVEAGFIPVGLNDILDMWIGNSEKNLHHVFQVARSETPNVLFFDEVDALGASRTDMKRSGGRKLINQFLNELDGVQYSNDGVLILAATNTPWHMDAAFRRPGRFDRIIFVPPPDLEGRAAILKILLKDKPKEQIDYMKLAKKTQGLSGADLKAVVDIAIESKLRDSLKAGKPLPIGQKELNQAAGRVKPSTKEWFATARNYALYSNEGGIYDDILKYMKLK